MNAPDPTDLDERLARYATELDDRMPALADLSGRPRPGRPSVTDAADPIAVEVGRGSPAPAPSHRVWLAAAAAIVLVVAGSVVWWRGAAPTDLDVSNPGVIDGSDPSNGPATGSDGTAPLAPLDPLTWATTGLATRMSAPAAVVPFGDGLLAVGSSDVLSPVSWLSADGTTWETETPMANTGGAPRSVATDGSVAVAVGMAPGNAMSWVTSDGTTWESFAFPGASQVYAVAHTADGFLAVGSAFVAVGVASDTVGPAAWRSDDGRTWTFVELPIIGRGEARDVAAVGDVTVVVGVDDDRPMLLTNQDGRWSRVQVAGTEVGPETPGAVTAVAAKGDGFVAVGAWDRRAAMWESADGINWPSRSVSGITDGQPAVEQPIVSFVDVAATDRAIVAIPNSTAQGLDGSTAWVSLDDGEWTATVTGADRVERWSDRFVALGLEVWLSSAASGRG